MEEPSSSDYEKFRKNSNSTEGSTENKSIIKPNEKSVKNDEDEIDDLDDIEDLDIIEE